MSPRTYKHSTWLEHKRQLRESGCHCHKNLVGIRQARRRPDVHPGRLTRGNRRPVIFDGRNLYDPARMAILGIHYYGIGRGLSVRHKAA